MAAAATRSLPVSRSRPSPEYNFAGEENFPSLFLKRVDKAIWAKAAAASLSISNPSIMSNSSSNGPKAPQSTDGGLGPGSSS